MGNDFYVAKGAKIKCLMGTMEGEMKFSQALQHNGTYKVESGTPLPTYQMNNKSPKKIISTFGRCNCPLNPDFSKEVPEAKARAAMIATNAASGMKTGLCTCNPSFPAPWIMPNMQVKDGSAMELTNGSFIVCSKGFGVVSIVKKASRPVGVHTSSLSASGKPLSPEAQKALNQFRGDQYKPVTTFNGSLPQDKQVIFAATNCATTCGMNENLDDHLPVGFTNQGNMTAEQKEILKEMAEERKNVTKVTEDTVMQKVIPTHVAGIMLSGSEVRPIGGCITKASDAAPYTCNVHEVNAALRLDYPTNPYAEMCENGDDVYIVRYTCPTTPTNKEYPQLSENKPPCTGTGYTGSDNTMIPEYNVDGSTSKVMTAGAIFKVDTEGNEVIMGYYDPITNTMKKVI